MQDSLPANPQDQSEPLISGVAGPLDLGHLAFNLYWLWRLGSAVERVLGPAKYLAFAAAAVSSSAQLAVSGTTGHGFSGVGYAIFGLIWASRTIEPRFGEALDDRTETLFWLWLIGCIVATWLDVANVGNTAHVSGLVFGSVAARLLIPSAPRPGVALAGVVLLMGVAAVPLFWNPWSAAWMAHQRYKAHVAGDYDRAIATYRRSIALGGDRLWALENLVFAYRAKHADRDVAATLDEIRARDPRVAAEIEAELQQESARKK